MTEEKLDRWADWLLHRRHGDDAAQMQAMIELLRPVRERVLDHAAIAPGQTVLDVGAGDGLIAWGALERVGADGAVIFSDISQDLLNHCHARAQQLGVLERCRFVRASAADLQPIADNSVDAVTTRSVLIYVADKQRALSEFWRVLRPGGRISIFEPINRFGMAQRECTLFGFDIQPIDELARKVRAQYQQAVPADDPMINFDERDLIDHAERAGFVDIQLELQAQVSRMQPASWKTQLHTAPNPHAPTLGEAMTRADRGGGGALHGLSAAAGRVRPRRTAQRAGLPVGDQARSIIHITERLAVSGMGGTRGTSGTSRAGADGRGAGGSSAGGGLPADGLESNAGTRRAAAGAGRAAGRIAARAG
jgi:ubiquinone/menaquinone biosynthesis C-methylase UbiE